jgi:hypothetical protein
VVCVRAVDDRESPAERLGSVTSALASKQRRENPFAGFVARVFVAKTVPTALCAKTGCAWDASSGITATVIGGSDQATAMHTGMTGVVSRWHTAIIDEANTLFGSLRRPWGRARSLRSRPCRPRRWRRRPLRGHELGVGRGGGPLAPKTRSSALMPRPNPIRSNVVAQSVRSERIGGPLLRSGESPHARSGC